MQRVVTTTLDGSSTIAIPDLEVSYHSKHGAVQESLHVFIQAGLAHALEQFAQLEELRVFEMGFGTGLNALLSMEHCSKKLHYTAIEQYPLAASEYGLLNYRMPFLAAIHAAAWEQDVQLTPTFTLHKVQQDLLLYAPPTKRFHLLYYDAFAPAAQPHLWTQACFEHLYTFLEIGGILVTYCSKGDVRRAMLAAGFSVEKLQGPPGKREMLRATKRA